MGTRKATAQAGEYPAVEISRDNADGGAAMLMLEGKRVFLACGFSSACFYPYLS